MKHKTLYLPILFAALGSTASAEIPASITAYGGEIVDFRTYCGIYSEDNPVSGGQVLITAGPSVNINDIYGGWSFFSSASDNTVTVTGGVIAGNVCGGIAYSDATDNTVNLVGNGATLQGRTGGDITIRGSVEGGTSAGGHGITARNTVNVYGTGITARNLYCAGSNLNFHLTPGMASGDTMLTLSGEEDTDLRGANIGVRCSGSTKLGAGSTVTLIAKSGGELLADGSTTYKVDVVKGVTGLYNASAEVQGNHLVLTLDQHAVPTVDVNTLKSMTETRAEVAALINAATDFMATTGMQQATQAARAAAASGKTGAAPFAAVGGSHLRYNTGSHVNDDGFNAALGVAKAYGNYTVGLAGEYGMGDYKSYAGGVRGSGDSKLYGGALLADWRNRHGWHAEGALRFGRTSADYSAVTPLGYTHYSDRASYRGCLIGGGRELKVSRKSGDTVDLYARYMYGNTNGSNTTADSGEALRFSAVNSHRTMAGVRYNHLLTDTATLYAGAAWMHEFDGDARSVIGGFTSPSPSLKGSSGMAEIGTVFAPFDSQHVLLNLNVQGWTGVQRGISGSAGCSVKF